MEIATSLLHGFAVALAPANIFWCFVGCFLGTVVGILPGLGPAATIAMLLPLTYNMNPAGGIIMLCGIYYGAKYGGSTTSILLNMPGESSSVVTCIDGYQMARRGRAGPALGIAAIASFIAGTFGVIALTLIAPPIAAFALSFSAPEYFALMCLGLSLVVLLAGSSLIKALLSMLLGLWLASIGTDLFTAQARFTFGQASLLGGVGGDRRLRDRRGALQHRGRRGSAAPAGAERVAKSAAQPGRAQGLPLRVSQRLGDRLPARRAAGRRRHHRVFHLLRNREGGVAPSGEIRDRRAGRRRGPRRRQQCRYRRRAGAAADPRHTGRLVDRDPALSADHMGRAAGPADDAGIARRILGPGRQHVYRQRDPAAVEPAAGPAVRADPAGARLYSLPRHSGDLGRRRLQRVGAAVRHRVAGRLRPARLADGETEISGRPADPRLRARRRDGARTAPVAHHVAGRHEPVPQSPAVGLHAGARAAAAALAPGGPPQPLARARGDREWLSGSSVRPLRRCHGLQKRECTAGLSAAKPTGRARLRGHDEEKIGRPANDETSAR